MFGPSWGSLSPGLPTRFFALHLGPMFWILEWNGPKEKPCIEICPNWDPDIVKDLKELGKKNGYDVKPLW